MPRLDSLRLDPEKLEKGAWLEHSSGLRFRVLRGNDKEFEERILLEFRKHLDPNDDSDDDELREQALKRNAAIRRKILREMFFRDRVKDWGEHLNSEDEAIPFTPDNAVELYADPGLNYIFDWLFVESTRNSRYRPDGVEAIEKNS